MRNAVLAQPMEESWLDLEPEQPAWVRSGAADQLQGWRSDFNFKINNTRPSVLFGDAPWYSDFEIEVVDSRADYVDNRALISSPNRLESRDNFADFGLERERLGKVYVHADEEAVEQFLSRHRTVTGLLLEGASALKTSFRDDIVLRLQVLPDDENAGSIYALVSWAGSVSDARRGLAKFDETWWAMNADRVAGRITFDYRLV